MSEAAFGEPFREIRSSIKRDLLRGHIAFRSLTFRDQSRTSKAAVPPKQHLDKGSFDFRWPSTPHVMPAQGDAWRCCSSSTSLGATLCQSSDAIRHNLLPASAKAALYLARCSL
jgi:hypothetical protein